MFKKANNCTVCLIFHHLFIADENFPPRWGGFCVFFWYINHLDWLNWQTFWNSCKLEDWFGLLTSSLALVAGPLLKGLICTDTRLWRAILWQGSDVRRWANRKSESDAVQLVPSTDSDQIGGFVWDVLESLASSAGIWSLLAAYSMSSKYSLIDTYHLVRISDNKFFPLFTSTLLVGTMMWGKMIDRGSI